MELVILNHRINLNWKSIFSDYRLYVGLFFLLRLIGITNPPLENLHSWRQVTGLMIARNFLEIDANIFYPRLDDICGKEGIVAFEFQLMSYLHFIVSSIFGYTDWYGRLINLVISSLGVFAFGAILNKYFDQKIVLFSTVALIVSSWFVYSRKMMPDTFSISLMMIGIYYAIEYINSNRYRYLVYFFILSTLGCLVKIPAVIFFSLFYCLVVNKVPQRKYLFGSILITLIITFSWYFLWGNYISEKYQTWTNLGKPLIEGITDIVTHPKEVIYNFVFYSFHSYLYFGLFIFGLYLIRKNKEKNLFLIFILISIIFVLYIFKAGYFFYHHSYYMVPYIPLMALVIGYGLRKLPKKLAVVLLIVASIESIANMQYDLFIPSNGKYKLELKSILDSLDGGQRTPVVINTDINPQQLYLSHRKGCYISKEQMCDINLLLDYRKKNYRWLIIDKSYEYSDVPLEKKFENEYYQIYQF